MSYLRLTETGSGSLAVRVTVEGLDTEFVSDPSMETTVSGRTRVYCLPPMGEGLVFEERCNIPEATLDVSPLRFTLFETESQDLSQLFMPMKSPSVSTWLTATIDDNDVSIPVMGTTGIANDAVVHIGTEAILLANPAVSGSNLLVSARGHWDTTAQYHYSADSSAGGQYAVLSSEPLRLRGRRVKVYLYGQGDVATDPGNLRWVGRVTSDPMLSSNGLSWSFSAEHSWAATRTKVGSELASPMEPRGIYYHSEAPLRIEIVETAASTQTTVTTLIGFYETQESFKSALNALLATDTAGLNSSYVAIEDPWTAGAWTLAITAGAATTAARVTVRSAVDGYIPGSSGWLTEDRSEVPTFSAGSTYIFGWSDFFTPGMRLVPRGCFGPSRFHWDGDPLQSSTYPAWRIYLSRPVSSDWSAILIDAPSTPERDALAISGTSLTLDTTNNHVTVANVVPAFGDFIFTPELLPEIRAGRLLGAGSVAALRDGIVTDAPRYANRGTAAWLTASDLDSWTTAVTLAARGRDYITSRLYMTYDAIELDKLLEAEFRLANLFPYLTSAGLVGLRQWSIPNAATATLTEIDDEILEGEWATIEADAHGTINTVILKRGYDPVQGEHTATDLPVIDVSSYSLDHETRKLEVAPLSRSQRGDELSAEDAAEIFAPVLGYFGQPYLSVKLAVSWKLSSLLLGDPVLVNSEHLPAFTGLRPMADVVGVIVGRRWALGEAYGSLTILVSPQNVAGYSPSARFVGTNATNVSANIWDITITTGLYAPTGYTEDEFFTAADKVYVATYDSASPTRLAGTIVSVTVATHVIRVNFGGVFTPGAGKWLLLFDDYASVTTTQHAYCYDAADTGRIGSAENARTFAP